MGSRCLQCCAVPAASARARTPSISVLYLLAVLQHTAAALQARDECTPYACTLPGTTLVVEQTPSRAVPSAACHLLPMPCNRRFCSTPGRPLPALLACRGQHPAASILLRLRGGQTHLRAGVAVRPGSLCLIPGLRGPVGADCGGCSHHAQCHSRWERFQ